MKSHADVPAGRYVVVDNRIRFTVASPQGQVDYEGSVLRDTFDLEWHSRINNNRGRVRYDLVALILP